MKKGILEQILPIVKVTKEEILKVVNGIHTEYPLIIKELLKWKLINNIIQLIFQIVIGGNLIFLIFFSAQLMERNSYDSWELTIFLCTIGLLTVIIWFLSTLGNILQIVIAPKIYLLEYLKTFLKDN